MNRVGIDLGTTNTVAAVEDHVLAIGEEGASSLPSVVAFLPNGRVLVGEAARRRRSIDGPNTLFSAKRILGRRLSDGVTAEFRERYPFELVDAGGDRPAFRTRAGLHTPTEVAAILLGEIHTRLAGADEGVEAVITVPTGFLEQQREATREAARAAGFDPVRLVDEPEATAWAYRNEAGVEGVVAVYDLGGGTFDVSVLEMGTGPPRLLARACDPYLGGDDVDARIADWVAREVLKQHNWDLTNYAEVQTRLLAECERAKMRLASRRETVVDLTQVDPECPIAAEGLPIQRELLDRLAGDLVRRTFVTCDQALRLADVRPSDVTTVLLAGGSAHLPAVRSGVEGYFGRPGRADVEPTEVVARGASLAGGGP